MNRTLTNYQDPLQKTKVDQIVKLLLFRVGSLHLALAVDYVQKILTYMPIYGSGLNHFGIAHIGEQEVTVIDLHRRLFQKSQEDITGQRGYLILSRNSVGEPFCVWVGETPTLLDVPLSKIRVLPESYRRSDTLSIASHVLVLARKVEDKGQDREPDNARTSHGMPFGFASCSSTETVKTALDSPSHGIPVSSSLTVFLLDADRLLQ